MHRKPIADNISDVHLRTLKLPQLWEASFFFSVGGLGFGFYAEKKRMKATAEMMLGSTDNDMIDKRSVLRVPVSLVIDALIGRFYSRWARHNPPGASERRRKTCLIYIGRYHLRCH